MSMSISSEPVVLVHPLVIVGIQGIRSIPENTFSLQSTGVINVQQMQRHFEYKTWRQTLYDGFEFSAGYYVYSRALVKITRKIRRLATGLRRACEGFDCVQF